MGCFEDYMQFRDEVEAARKRLNVMEKGSDADADNTELETKMPPERQIQQLKIQLLPPALQD